MASPPDELRKRFDDARAAFDGALAHADWSAVTSAGWTVQELVAHLAFWLETVPPFVSGAYRGDPTAFEVTFPSGYVAEGEWPSADEHNAREAAWGADRSPGEVQARFDAAADACAAFLATVTVDEVTANAGYFADVPGHLDAHRPELERG